MIGCGAGYIPTLPAQPPGRPSGATATAATPTNQTNTPPIPPPPLKVTPGVTPGKRAIEIYERSQDIARNARKVSKMIEDVLEVA